MRIALTVNPNSGKTTMYNALTGRNEKVGNWAGVTVEKKEHPIKKAYYGGEEQLIAVDLPGAYSMSPFTSEESITSAYVKHENPDVIINIVDATNLSRSLFFTTQLLELGIPVVVALNKSDINEKKDTKIDVDALSAKLGCPVIRTVSTSAEGLKAVVETAVARANESQLAPYSEGNIDLTDKKAVENADRERFDFVNKIVSKVETRKVLTKDKNSDDRIDAVLTNPVAGILIFAGIMFLVFQISQAWVGPLIADTLVAWLETFQAWVGTLLENANPLLSALLVDGVIGGVSAVIGFLPLVMVMYFLIALLEDCGYMSRAAVVLDPIFKKVGLSGKSVIPFVITTGCAVPGIMASRTIRNDRERRATAMLSPFMPCGAKIPVIALFAGAFFDGAGWVSFVMYATGIVLIFLGALLVNKIAGYKARKSFFIMELPDHKWGDDGVMIFGDCAVIPNPTAEELAAIAIASAASGKQLVDIDPRVAMLSFSTKGSAKHDNVTKVQEATKMAHELAPELQLDGELQADAALVESVGQLKSPGSTVAGHANVLVFPDLQAGNIGYKLVQRLAGAEAIGPIIQGLAKPVSDLSRGCSVDDIVSVVAITAVKAQA